MADAARLIGEPSSQGVRDVCSGRKRATAELLSRLAEVAPIDLMYVLTGAQEKRNISTTVEELRGEYRADSGPGWEDVLEMVYDALNAKGLRIESGRKLREVVDAVMVVLRLEKGGQTNETVRRKIETIL